jgi:hypothetical protein
MEGNMNPYEALANYIIAQTVRDYCSALRTERKTAEIMRRKPFNPKTYYPAEERHWMAVGTIRECEAFFGSPLYQRLTKVDAEYLMEKVRKELVVNARPARKADADLSRMRSGIRDVLPQFPVRGHRL